MKEILFPIDLPIAQAIFNLAAEAVDAVDLLAEKISAPEEIRDEVIGQAVSSFPSTTYWYARSSKSWSPSQEDWDVLCALKRIACNKIANALLSIRGEDGIGECPVGANPDGVVWFWSVLQDAAHDVVLAHYGDTRPGVRPAHRISEAARALDAIVSLGITPAWSHKAAVAEFRRVGLHALADIADGGAGYFH
jgi:hypothetical protein